jgi:hypothetical protein
MKRRVKELEQFSLAKQVWVEEVERLLQSRDETIRRLINGGPASAGAAADD